MPKTPADLTRVPMALLPLVAALGSVGCAVGPNFHRPAPPATDSYLGHPPAATVATPGVSGGASQSFASGQDIAADWWTLFHSRPLSDLIEQSLAKNPDLKAAQAALAVAQENVRAQRGVFYPSVALDFQADRQRQSGQISPQLNSNVFVYNLFTPQVTVSYTPDVFGLNRRTVESLAAQAQEARFQMIAAYTTLTSNVVVAAIQIASLQAQIDATRELIDSTSSTVKILEYQFGKGYSSRLDLAAQESQLAQVSATLPPLLKQLAQQRHQLAALAGRFPSDAPADHFELASLDLPEELPLSLPAALVAQRPDVLQAEANLHDASAKIGIAIANRLPNIALSASTGSTAAAMEQLFSEGTGFWAFGGELAAPIFQGGQLMHLERAAKAAFTEAAEQYRSTVLGAMQNVADTLSALEQDAAALQAAENAASAAQVTVDLARRQWQGGYAAYLALLAAEQAYQQTRITLVTAQGNRFADTAALFQALGGGWWHRADLAGGNSPGGPP